MAERLTRRFVELSHGAVHVAEVGDGRPVILLHQTPRSWDEYRDVLPLLGRTRRAIAMDTVGFGDSAPLPDGTDSIEAWASVVLELLDALGLDRIDLVGHHTGATVAIEVAGRAPERIRALVLSSAPLDDAETRAKKAAHPIVDHVTPQDDGSHLLELWRGRAGFYPQGRRDLLERFVGDALRARLQGGAGHLVVARYDHERGVAALTCPVLLIAATADPFSYPAVPRLQAAIPHAEVAKIEGGMVPLPDQLPGEFAAAVDRFLAAVDAGALPAQRVSR